DEVVIPSYAEEIDIILNSQCPSCCAWRLAARLLFGLTSGLLLAQRAVFMHFHSLQSPFHVARQARQPYARHPCSLMQIYPRRYRFHPSRTMAFMASIFFRMSLASAIWQRVRVRLCFGFLILKYLSPVM